MTASSQFPTREKLDALKWRCIGPSRGGRVVAVAGDPADAMVFYFGACAGGIWKTAGLERAKARGVRLGRPRTGAKIEAAIRSRLSRGEGVKKIAKAIGVGNGTVSRIKAARLL